MCNHLCYNLPYTWNDVAWWIQIIGRLGTLTLLVFWFQVRYDRKTRKEDDEKRRYRTHNTILNIINAQIKSFNDSRLICIITTEGYDVFYDIGLLNTTEHDSIINS